MSFIRPGLWRLLRRALLLKCPHCGGGGIFESFFKLKAHCPTCGLRLERGEGDYFVGAYLFNLIAVELILFFCVCGFVYVTRSALDGHHLRDGHADAVGVHVVLPVLQDHVAGGGYRHPAVVA